MKKMKYLLPIIAIIAVMLMAGYTYSWFVTGADARMNVIEIGASASVSMTFNIDGENQTAPLSGQQVKAFNGQKAVDESSHWIARNGTHEDKVYIASYPLSFFIRNTENLQIQNANVHFDIENVKVQKFQGEELVINERLHDSELVSPEERFTWEIIWDDDNDGTSSAFGPYGKVDSSDFYINSGDPTTALSIPYLQTINCTFNIIYVGQELYWSENYRTTPTSTLYDACHYSAESYKGCRFELVVTLGVELQGT
ncbi:MAG TPA: hypothetical protein VJZ69_05825 [Clostridia bacterium]|nr:hypothetical protein [Clostridia bacterium]